ncbi:MAG: TraR/DksA C4-type zinc finger protein [Acidobacteriota bacterium]
MTPPKKARIHTLIVCAECGEAAMETRIRRFGGRELCIPCFEKIEVR